MYLRDSGRADWFEADPITISVNPIGAHLCVRVRSEGVPEAYLQIALR